jgi:hypothetical protein
LLADGKVLIAGGEDARHKPLASAELYDPALKKMLKLPPLNAARKGHTATLLENGSVLFIGGGTKVLEIFDPQQQKFQIIGQIEKPCKYHTATLLPDGRVLVAGGGAASAEWLNLAAGTRGRAPLAVDREQHTATLLADGRVLLAGGGAGAEIFDPRTNAAEPLSWEDGRRLHAAELLPDGRVLLLGGTSTEAMATVFIFDPATLKFLPGKPLKFPRFGHTATFLDNGSLLVYGGADAPAEIYCPDTSDFHSGATLNAARRGHTATLLPNGQVLLAGGADGEASKRAEIFDPGKDLFRQVGNLNLPRSGHTATLLPNGQVLIAGGVAGSQGSLWAEVYFPQTGVFNYASNSKLHSRRSHHTATLLADGRVLLAGGEDNGRALASAETFEFVHGAFKHTAAMTTARTQQAAVRLADGSVLLSGGRQGSELLHSAEIFFPARGVFAPTGNLLAARAGHAAVLLGTGKVLILGGEVEGGQAEACEIFDPLTGTFAPGPELSRRRPAPVVTVLPGGDLLVTGGGISAVERYSPAAGVFYSSPSLLQARLGQSVTLLLDGRLLVAGGEEQGTRLDSSEWAGCNEAQVQNSTSPAAPEISRPPAGLQPGQMCSLSGHDFSTLKSGARSPYPPVPMISPRLSLQALESGSAQGTNVSGPWMEFAVSRSPQEWARADAQIRFMVPADLPAGFFALRIYKQGVFSPAIVVGNLVAPGPDAVARETGGQPNGAREEAPPGTAEGSGVFWSEDFNGPAKFRPAGWKDASAEKSLEAEILNCGDSCARVNKKSGGSWGRVLSPLLSCDLSRLRTLEIRVKAVTPGVQWNTGLKEEHTLGYWPLGEYSDQPQTRSLDLEQWVRLKGKQDFRIQINLLAKSGKPQHLDVDFIKIFFRPPPHASAEGKTP